jgi:hypothetical protein
MAVAWTDTTAGVVVKDVTPNLGVKIIHVRTPATFVNGTDTIAIDLKKFGANNISGVLMFEETTAGSITLQSAVSATLGGVSGFTTAVSAASVLTITPLLPANTCITSFIIFAY